MLLPVRGHGRTESLDVLGRTQRGAGEILDGLDCAQRGLIALKEIA